VLFLDGQVSYYEFTLCSVFMVKRLFLARLYFMVSSLVEAILLNLLSLSLALLVCRRSLAKMMTGEETDKSFKITLGCMVDDLLVPKMNS